MEFDKNDILELNNYKIWYQNLSDAMKKAVLTDAITKFPYLSNHMKMFGVKGSDKEFLDHFTFKLMIEVIRKSP